MNYKQLNTERKNHFLQLVNNFQLLLAENQNDKESGLEMQFRMDLYQLLAQEGNARLECAHGCQIRDLLQMAYDQVFRVRQSNGKHSPELDRAIELLIEGMGMLD